ncbi:MAG TPA: hypothetical protein DCQ34_04785 [Chitinophagaceae bacterium]|nr:hypothetical protein [Chitinophagaceae bacterium]HRF26067.1 diacylglycerol kinase family protein [Ferruginibacter sp.]
MLSLFINPSAGKGKPMAVAAMAEKILTQRHIPFAVYAAEWPESLEHCTEAWIIGGDGTLNFFINRYADIQIPLVMLKAGTGNDFAWALYGNRTNQEIVEWVLHQHAHPVDMGLCNGRRFLNAVGLGFDGEVLRSMQTIRKLGGHLGYLWIVFKQIFRYREMEYELECNGRLETGKYLLLHAANARRTGGGFMISPASELRDASLNLVRCQALPVWKRLRYLPVIEKGLHLDLPFISHNLVNKVFIRAHKPVYAQVDGELIYSRDFDIQLKAGALMFRY